MLSSYPTLLLQPSLVSGMSSSFDTKRELRWACRKEVFVGESKLAIFRLLRVTRGARAYMMDNRYQKKN